MSSFWLIFKGSLSPFVKGLINNFHRSKKAYYGLFNTFHLLSEQLLVGILASYGRVAKLAVKPAQSRFELLKGA
jgi:hypothetical protein